MSTPDPTTDPTAPDLSATTDATVQVHGAPVDAQHVPEPASGVRGADQVDDMDSSPGHGTTTGADGETAAREALRKDLGERPAGADEESGSAFEETAALGATDDPEGGSIQRDGA